MDAEVSKRLAEEAKKRAEQHSLSQTTQDLSIASSSNSTKLQKIDDWFANINFKKDKAPEQKEGADDAEKAKTAAIEQKDKEDNDPLQIIVIAVVVILVVTAIIVCCCCCKCCKGDDEAGKEDMMDSGDMAEMEAMMMDSPME